MILRIVDRLRAILQPFEGLRLQFLEGLKD